MLRSLDVKALVMAWLREQLEAPVVSSRLEDGTRTFVRVIATGGLGRTNRLMQHTQLTIDCYAASTGLAARLASDVEALMYGLPESPVPVVEVTGNTPADNPDPDTGHARYSATYQVRTRVRQT